MESVLQRVVIKLLAHVTLLQVFGLGRQQNKDLNIVIVCFNPN